MRGEEGAQAGRAAAVAPPLAQAEAGGGEGGEAAGGELGVGQVLMQALQLASERRDQVRFRGGNPYPTTPPLTLTLSLSRALTLTLTLTLALALALTLPRDQRLQRRALKRGEYQQIAAEHQRSGLGLGLGLG